MEAAKIAVNAPSDGDQQHGGWRQHKQGVAARHHVDAGGDHRGGMDQGADRRRAFHGVGQPDVERHLRRFPHRSNEQQNADGREYSQGAQRLETVGFSLVEDSLEVDTPESPEDEHYG